MWILLQVPVSHCTLSHSQDTCLFYPHPIHTPTCPHMRHAHTHAIHTRTHTHTHTHTRTHTRHTHTLSGPVSTPTATTQMRFNDATFTHTHTHTHAHTHTHTHVHTLRHHKCGSTLSHSDDTCLFCPAPAHPPPTQTSGGSISSEGGCSVRLV